MSYGLWLALGGILVISEAFAPGFVLLWFGLAALATGGLVFFMPEISWHWQAVTFALLSLILLTIWFRLRSLEEAKDHPTLNQRGAAMTGRVVEIETAITNGQGSAIVGDGVWSVRGPDMPAGSKARVTGADGAVLIVEPLEKDRSADADDRNEQADTGQAPNKTL